MYSVKSQIINILGLPFIQFLLQLFNIFCVITTTITKTILSSGVVQSQVGWKFGGREWKTSQIWLTGETFAYSCFLGVSITHPQFSYIFVHFVLVPLLATHFLLHFSLWSALFSPVTYLCVGDLIHSYSFLYLFFNLLYLISLNFITFFGIFIEIFNFC